MLLFTAGEDIPGMKVCGKDRLTLRRPFIIMSLQCKLVVF